jgi:hypothetical protein
MNKLPKSESNTMFSWIAERDDIATCAPRIHAALSLPLQLSDLVSSNSLLAAGVHLSPQDFELGFAGVASNSFDAPTIRTFGCTFCQCQEREFLPSKMPASDLARNPGPTTEDAADVAGIADINGRYTRLKPPKDLIKLEDRLRLLLQPPLESLLAASDLRFPFRPFHFQLDGIAFLYPRHQAVLADEMGLGKTMQAITAVRLLIHHG